MKRLVRTETRGKMLKYIYIKTPFLNFLFFYLMLTKMMIQHMATSAFSKKGLNLMLHSIFLMCVSNSLTENNLRKWKNNALNKE